MHMQRQLRDAIADTHEGIEGVDVFRTHSLESAGLLAGRLGDEGRAAVVVYEIGTMAAQRINKSDDGPRLTYRGFMFGIVCVTTDEDAAEGRLAEITAESERRIFAPRTPLRRLATRDIIDAGSEISVIATSERAIANHAVIECHVPMLEGVPDSKAP